MIALAHRGRGRDGCGRDDHARAPRRTRLRAGARVRVRPVGRDGAPLRIGRRRRRGGDAESLGAGDVDLFLFSVGTSASRELVPPAADAGAICVDKSSAYRLVDGYPLVVPEVNGARALEALERDRIVANPNCCTIPLTCVLAPLHEEAGLARVHVATYQSVSGAGAQRMESTSQPRIRRRTTS